MAGAHMEQPVSHRRKAAAEVAGELIGSERPDQIQNPRVRPSVIFKKQSNVFSCHRDLLGECTIDVIS
jgi:hypothetical protein